MEKEGKGKSVEQGKEEIQNRQKRMEKDKKEEKK